MMYGWYNQGMSGGWWAVMIFGMVVFWTVLVFGVVVLVRHNGHVHGGVASTSPTTPAIDILNERFARGELNEEEFKRRLALLKNQT
jgi:putative membrane protein